MDPTRRKFLAATGKGLLVFGLPALACRKSDLAASSGSARTASISFRDRGPWNAIVDQAQKERRPILVLRVPSTELGEMGFFASLDALLAATNPRDADAVFAEAIVACLSADEIQECVVGAQPGDDAILIDAASRRVDGSSLPMFSDDAEMENRWRMAFMRWEPSDLSEEDAAIVAKVGTTLVRLLQGEHGERLRERAAVVRTTASHDSLDALESLRARPEDAPLLLSRLHSVTPLIALAGRESADPEASYWFGWVLWRRVKESSVRTPGSPALPYGLTLASGERHPLRCGASSGTVPCGMTQLIPATRQFVGLLAR